MRPRKHTRPCHDDECGYCAYLAEQRDDWSSGEDEMRDMERAYERWLDER